MTIIWHQVIVANVLLIWACCNTNPPITLYTGLQKSDLAAEILIVIYLNFFFRSTISSYPPLSINTINSSGNYRAPAPCLVVVPRCCLLLVDFYTIIFSVYSLFSGPALVEGGSLAADGKLSGSSALLFWTDHRSDVTLRFAQMISSTH